MKNQKLNVNDVAVIGLSIRFPGSSSPQEFWDNLVNGKESISFFDEPNTGSTSRSKNFVKALPELKRVDLFDADFFNYTHAEASLMDPQNRLFLEAAWEALETSGYHSGAYKDKIGVFAGCNWSSYLLRNLRNVLDESMQHENEAYYLNLCSNDFLATNVAYKLDLKGPSIGVQTFCTTGLASVHVACQNLLLGTCTMALAGGSHIRVPQNGYYFEEDGHDSKDGHCRSFDADASGTVPGNGVGVLVLKKVSDAITDRDHIYAVIKGTSLVNDGQPPGKVSFNGISIKGQVTAMKDVLNKSKVDPETVSFIEASGGATQYVDRAEIDALKKVYKAKDTSKKILVGSVQPNIGHLGHVSGLASLMKAILSLYHKSYPPTININKVNPKLKLDNSSLKINRDLSPLPDGDGPSTAAVNCFGIGGTYIHTILAQSPKAFDDQSGRKNKPFTLSAKTESALREKTNQLSKFLKEKQDSLNLADVAYTLNLGRKPMQYRTSITASSAYDLISALDQPEVSKIDMRNKAKPFVVFLFAGYGIQHQLKLGNQLYLQEKDFRNHFDTCACLINEKCNIDIVTALTSRNDQKKTLSDPLTGGLMIFAFQASLAKLLIKWGVSPNAMIGYSAGEFTAAYIADSLNLEQVIELLINKLLLIRKASKGKMLAVNASEEEIQPYLTTTTGHVCIAAQNSPEMTIVSGESTEIGKLYKQFLSNKIACTKLEGEYAFHSPIMGEISNEVETLFEKYKFDQPSIPFLSDTTVDWATKDCLNDKRYWSNKLVNKVRFYECLTTLAASKETIEFIEIGPQALTIPTANNLSTPQYEKATFSSCLPILGSNKDSEQKLVELLTGLWSRGIPIDWINYYEHESRSRLPLPTYPFERKSFWIESESIFRPKPVMNAAADDDGLSLLNNEAERFIGESWMKLFGLKKISPKDDFFELGGHSLLSTMFFNKARLRYPEVYLTLTDLYDHPTVEALAVIINTQLSKKESFTDSYANGSKDENYTRLRSLIIQTIADELNLKTDKIELDEPFDGLSNSRIPPRLYQEIRKEFGMPVYEYEIIRHTTVNKLIDYVFREIETFNKSFSHKAAIDQNTPPQAPARNMLDTNPKADAVFVYSTPRAGSTLFRLMLAGHPKLFSPPEIKMLLHNNLEDFYSKSANHVIAHGGVVRSLKELLELSQKDAMDYLKSLVQSKTPIKGIYKIIQANLKGKILVEKSAELSESVEILNKPEAIFQNPKYVFLVRHPYSVIESIVRNRIYSINDHHISDPLRFAENEWRMRNQNILTFVNSISEDRYLIVRYEDLLENPTKTMEKVSEFIGIAFDKKMVDPYASGRMIDGDGDPNIFNHDKLEPELAAVWKSIKLPISLTSETRSLANFFQYDLPSDPIESSEHDELTSKFMEEKLDEIDRMNEEQVNELIHRNLNSNDG